MPAAVVCVLRVQKAVLNSTLVVYPRPFSMVDAMPVSRTGTQDRVFAGIHEVPCI